MDQKEKDFMNEIKKASEEIQAPKALDPEHVEEMLKSQPKKFRWKLSYTAGLVAACLVLVCGTGLVQMSRQGGGESNVGKAGTSAEAGADSGNTGLEAAESYEEVYAYLEEYMDDLMVLYDAGDMSREYAVEETQMMEDTSAADSAAGAKSASYSETNVRQKGVDEADVVKTDGRYIYTLRDNGRVVAVVDTAGGQMKAVSEIEVEDEKTICEFYVSEGKLTLTGDVYNEEAASQGWYVTGANTFAEVYDLADPAKPEQIGEVTQSGSYTSSRMTDGHLYLFSRYAVNCGTDIMPKDTELYVPMVNDRLIAEENIYLPTTIGASVYEVISSVDMEKPDEVKDSKAIFTEGGELYVSNDNIYWYETKWEDEQKTSIRRIAYQDGELTAKSSGTVKGYILDSFCIDEYEGYLRVITTEGDVNHVFVLNDKLEEVGSITGLAEDERVYSARLLGDVGYFVTYKETDPLFSVDFSDPENPEIIGELKIPGFSEYLHFYGEDKLLGIGMDTDEEGFTTNGVKLSMFDISDSTDVKEVQKYVMENVYSADVMYDYRAALIDEGKNVIGFSAYDGDGEKYYVFSYHDKAGFECLMSETVNGTGYQPARGVYIDTTLYVVKGNIIEAYSMENYQKTDDIIL